MFEAFILLSVMGLVAEPINQISTLSRGAITLFREVSNRESLTEAQRALSALAPALAAIRDTIITRVILLFGGLGAAFILLNSAGENFEIHALFSTYVKSISVSFFAFLIFVPKSARALVDLIVTEDELALLSYSRIAYRRWIREVCRNAGVLNSREKEVLEVLDPWRGWMSVSLILESLRDDWDKEELVETLGHLKREKKVSRNLLTGAFKATRRGD